MITRRIHTIDGLPISSKEWDNYYIHIHHLLNLISQYVDDKVELPTFTPPNILH